MPLVDLPETLIVEPYKAEVAELLAAGEGKGYAIVVKTDSASTERLKFGKAANNVNKTARLIGSEADKPEKGKTTLTFALTKRHKTKTVKQAELASADGTETLEGTEPNGETQDENLPSTDDSTEPVTDNPATEEAPEETVKEEAVPDDAATESLIAGDDVAAEAEAARTRKRR